MKTLLNQKIVPVKSYVQFNQYTARYRYVRAHYRSTPALLHRVFERHGYTTDTVDKVMELFRQNA